MAHSVSAMILAGGRATRMGGQDKGLIPLAGQPMIQHVINSIAPQVDHLAINANRNQADYAALGYPVIGDDISGYQGPLAGMAAGLGWSPSERLLMLPCDGPLVPNDLVARLLAALGDGDVAVAHDGKRLQPVHVLLHRRCLPSLQRFMAEGGRKIDRWYAELDQRTADLSDQQDLFVNVNTPMERDAMEQRLNPTANDCGHDAPSLPVEEALARMLNAVTPITGRRQLALRSALGQVLAEPITAPAPVPAHDNAAMDGYALRTIDAEQKTLQLVGSAFAGHPFTGTLGAGECVRIMTGGVVPAGADAVVMQERAERDGNTVVINQWPELGENIRRAGEDLQTGDTILPAGRRITAADLGLIASTGRAEVTTWRPLRVAFFSTGDELRSLGELLEAGQIYDSNRYTIYGMLNNLHIEIIDRGVVKDDEAALTQALDECAADADVVLTSGGVSVGEADYMVKLLRAHGEPHFWSIAMKPGRPLTFGRYRQAWYFGLPGNPVSVMATFSQIVAPALRKLAGENPPYQAPRFQLPCLSDLKKKPGRQEFQRGRMITTESGQRAVESVGRQGSGILRSMSEANCFIVLPADAEDMPAGSQVEVEPFTLT